MLHKNHIFNIPYQAYLVKSRFLLKYQTMCIKIQKLGSNHHYITLQLLTRVSSNCIIFSRANFTSSIRPATLTCGSTQTEG